MSHSRIGFASLFSLLFLAAAIAAPQPASAQFEDLTVDIFGDSPATAEGEEIVYEAQIVPAEAKPGDEVTLQLTATIAEGWHTYSLTQPVLGGSPTVIKIEDAGGLKVLGKEFTANRPPNVREDTIGKAKFRFEEYEGKITFSRRLQVPNDIAAGEVVVTGEILHQVCKNVCLPGKTKFSAQVTIVGGKSSTTAPRASSTEKKELSIRAATWQISLEPSAVPPGGTATLTVALQLEKPWHIYGMDQQKLTNGLSPGLPTAIEVTQHKGLTLLGESFQGPTPHVSQDDETYPGLKILTHEGEIVWTREITVPQDAQMGELPISGRIGYMICTDKKCERPTGLTFQGNLTVAPEPSEETSLFALTGPLKSSDVVAFVEDFAIARAAVEKTDAPTDEKPALAGQSSVKQNRALLPFLFLAFTAGFFALLTPCVFPMVPITVSFFLKQSEKEHHRPLRTATIYCLGIIGTFTILGIAMSVIFGAASLNQFINLPWINLVIAGVLIFFGANLLGLFEIRMPAWLFDLFLTPTRPWWNYRCAVYGTDFYANILYLHIRIRRPSACGSNTG